MARLSSARTTLAAAVASAIPADDPLRPLLDAVVSLTAALEAAEARVGQDVVDQLARAAALGANEQALALVRVQMRRSFAVIAALLVLAALTGVAVGWLLAAT